MTDSENSVNTRNHHSTNSAIFNANHTSANILLENGTSDSEEDAVLSLDNLESPATQNSKVTSLFSKIYTPIVNSLASWNQSTFGNGQEAPQTASIAPIKTPSMAKRKSQKLPGTVKLVVGAQYPPRYEPPIDEPKHIPIASTSHKEKAETISNSHIENIPIPPSTPITNDTTKNEPNTPMGPIAPVVITTNIITNSTVQINKENEKEERKKK